MALRTATLKTARREPTTAAEWRLRIDEIVAAGRAALLRRDTAALAAAYGDARGLADEQRAYEATKGLTEAVFSASGRGGDLGWLELYVEAAGALLTSLEANPREPVLLNYAGVLLYELTENDGARKLFQAALRLDSGVAHARGNLDALRGRKANVLKGRVAAAAKTLGARAARVAAAAKPAQGQKLSVCMIVKDEEEMLPGCLEPLAGNVDEIVVVDTGSTDRTREIAESFGATVVDFPWNGSFSDARNAGIDAATGHWFLWIDADEHFVPEDARRLRELVGRTWREAFFVVLTNFTGAEDSGMAVTENALRLIRRRPGHRFDGRIHEQISPSLPTHLGERFEHTRLRVNHYGYLKNRIRDKDKSRRNIELLEQEARERPTAFTWFNLGSEYLALARAHEARAHLDRSWEELRAEPAWHERGYASVLARRVALARRLDDDVAAAREAIAVGLEHFPGHVDLVFELAQCARQAGDADEAERLARACLESGDGPARYGSTVGSGTFLALALLAELRADAGDAEGAEAFYRQSLAEHPEYVGALLPLASSLLARGADPVELDELVPERPSAQALVATALYEAGHAEAAERWFRRILERQPSHEVAHVGLVEALLSRRRYADAVDAAACDPSSPAAAMLAKSRLFGLAALGDAEALAAAAAEAPVEAADRALFLGWADALAGRPAPGLPLDAAISTLTCLEALLRVEEIDAFATLLPLFERIPLPPRERREALAQMYLRRGFLESAADEWIEAAQTSPDARAFVGLAQVAYARGLAGDATELAREALRLDPANEQARRLVGRLPTVAA